MNDLPSVSTLERRKSWRITWKGLAFRPVQVTLVLLAASLLVFPMPTDAQVRRSQVQALDDDEYGARLALEDLADQIRSGKADASGDALLSGALHGLFTAATRRSLPKPPVPAPPMWDFRIDVAEANVTAPGAVEVRARVHLATERNPGEPISIPLRREGERWVIAEAGAFVVRIAEVQRQLAQRRGGR